MYIKHSQGVFDYYYESKRDYEQFAHNLFLKNTLIALDFLCKTSALTITFEDRGEIHKIDVVDVLVADKTNGITITQGKKNTYNPNTNTIGFYHTHGIKFRKNYKRIWSKRNRGFNSPVSLLAHELIHCYNEIYDTEDYHARKRNHTSRKQKIDNDGRDLSFPNQEEVFVIKMTNQVAKRLDEDKRSNYGRSYYPTDSVLSTKPLKKKNKNTIARRLGFS